VVAPAEVADEAARAKRLLDDFSPSLNQLALAEFLHRGHYDRHLRRARGIYRRRRDAFIVALDRHLPELAVEGIAAGVHLLLRLPSGTSDTAIAADARDTRIAVQPLSAFRIRPSDEGGLVIGYGRLHESAVEPAARALAGVIKTHL
jgi:GntR family transcriptional regulator / MocR family aminotransferase